MGSCSLASFRCCCNCVRSALKNVDTASPSVFPSSKPIEVSRIETSRVETGRPLPVSIPPAKDIPPARRQPTEISLDEIENLQLVTPKRRSGLRWVVGLLLLAGVGGVGYWQWDRLSPQLASAKTAIASGRSALWSKSQPEPSTPTVNSVETPLAVGDAEAGRSSASATDATDNPVASSDSQPDRLLNHRRYEVANADTLVALNANSGIRLKPEAQSAVNNMIAKAKAEGVQLGLISGFRTLADQDYLYFDLKAERGESAQTRAEVSAPPGYSEHHTGYAVDFIDESRPNTHLEESFETTAAFQWLEKNAAFFNFEMSFPKDNAAEVGYEPWHWRYVGNQESLELFYK